MRMLGVRGGAKAGAGCVRQRENLPRPGWIPGQAKGNGDGRALPRLQHDLRFAGRHQGGGLGSALEPLPAKETPVPDPAPGASPEQGRFDPFGCGVEPRLDGCFEKGGCKLGNKICGVMPFLDPRAHDPVGPGTDLTRPGPWMAGLRGPPGSRCTQDLHRLHFHPGVRRFRRLGSIDGVGDEHLDAEDGVPMFEQQDIGPQTVRGCRLHDDLIEIQFREGQPRLSWAKAVAIGSSRLLTAPAGDPEAGNATAQAPEPPAEHQGDPGLHTLVQGGLWRAEADGLVGEMGRSHFASAQREFAAASRATIGHIGAGVSRQHEPAGGGCTCRHLVVLAPAFPLWAILFRKWAIVER